MKSNQFEPKACHQSRLYLQDFLKIASASLDFDEKQSDRLLVFGPDVWSHHFNLFVLIILNFEVGKSLQARRSK